MLIHKATTPGSWAATGCAGVLAPGLLFNIVSRLQPVIPLADLVQGLVGSQVSSWWSTMEFGQYVFHYTIWDILYRPSYSSGAPVCHPLLRGTSSGPSSPCTWGSDQQCIFIPDVVQPLFPLELVLHLGHSTAPFLGQLGPNRLRLRPQ
jgi:hypothetical protein